MLICVHSKKQLDSCQKNLLRAEKPFTFLKKSLKGYDRDNILVSFCGFIFFAGHLPLAFLSADLCHYDLALS